MKSNDAMTTLALDLDGTLISCEERHCALMKQLCREDGMDEDFISRYWAAKREGASNMVALHALGHPAPDARAAAWNRSIEHWPWLGYDRLLPGVMDALAALARDETNIVVLTARSQPFFLRQQLDRLGLMPHLDALLVVPPNDAATAKARALRELKALAFIGDTESDADAAERAGMPFLALNGGMRSSAFWRARGRVSYPDLGAALAALPRP
ncbi:HAD family hydrolase [Roseateles sp. BYS78W]|uniref:phosphoglycolate phosphatase n=1 Tax=Pelomonas candidula TaxID=3299025 RepID=A0ABW7HHR6_9BURK